MSLSEFADRHTLAEIDEIAAWSRVKRNEQDRDQRIARVEQQAQANRRRA